MKMSSQLLNGLESLPVFLHVFFLHVKARWAVQGWDSTPQGKEPKLLPAGAFVLCGLNPGVQAGGICIPGSRREKGTEKRARFPGATTS